MATAAKRSPLRKAYDDMRAKRCSPDAATSQAKYRELATNDGQSASEVKAKIDRVKGMACNLGISGTKKKSAKRKKK